MNCRVRLVSFLALLTLRAGADDLDTFVEQSLKKYQVPGCAVAVVHQGKVVKLQGYGVRHKQQGGAVNPDTIFQIASATKALTATLVCTLVADKKLDLDEPVVNYLPELQLEQPYPTATVTTRDLLAHRSGLPTFGGDLVEKIRLSRPEIIRRIRFLPLSNGFRNKAGYSNIGIFLAGMVAQRVGGAAFEDLMRQRLFAPLGMNRSSFLTGKLPAGENVAYPHLPNGTVFDEYEDHSALGPAGAVSSTARDLGQWVLMLLARGKHNGKQLLSAEVIEEMFHPVMVEEPGIAETAPIDDNSGFAYGLVWGIFHYNGYKVLEKGGARMGMRSVVVLVPEKELGVVVLANLNGTILPEAIRARVLQDYLGPARYDLQQALWDKQTQITAFFARATERPTADPSIRPSRPLESYVGSYQQPMYGPLEIVRTSQGLAWQMGAAKYGGPLLPQGYNSFLLSYPAGVNNIPETVHFTLDEKGRAIELSTESYGRFTR
jgi:CubicO group peptidase (beta-lactamase class C family)